VDRDVGDVEQAPFGVGDAQDVAEGRVEQSLYRV
jgi:hypothetical protein